MSFIHVITMNDGVITARSIAGMTQQADLRAPCTTSAEATLSPEDLMQNSGEVVFALIQDRRLRVVGMSNGKPIIEEVDSR